MPNYKSHLVGGAVAYGVVLYLVTRSMTPSASALIEWGCFALAGSLFPDIDIKSKGQKLFFTILVILMIYVLLQKRYDIASLLALIAMLPLLSQHRGLFHKLWFVILAPACIGWMLCGLYVPACSTIIFYDVLFFVTGAVSHLWLDLGFRRMMRM